MITDTLLVASFSGTRTKDFYITVGISSDDPESGYKEAAVRASKYAEQQLAAASDDESRDRPEAVVISVAKGIDGKIEKDGFYIFPYPCHKVDPIELSWEEKLRPTLMTAPKAFQDTLRTILEDMFPHEEDIEEAIEYGESLAQNFHACYETQVGFDKHEKWLKDQQEL
jgi:hypothetical protein